jgi:hypothetical protein
MPIIKFTSRDQVPEGLAVVEKDGGFVVDVVDKTKLDQFRDNNVNLAKERDELKNKVDAYAAVIGDDPAAAAGELSELRSVNQQVKDGKLKGSEAVEQEVTRRVAAVKEGYDGQIRSLTTERDRERQGKEALDGRLKRTILEREVTSAILASDSGINPAATPDILARASTLYTVTAEEKLVPKQGEAVVYGQDGVSPMPVKEWLQKLVVEAPHFSLKSSGGGASGNTDSKLPGGYTQESWDKLSPTERIKLARKQAG